MSEPQEPFGTPIADDPHLSALLRAPERLEEADIGMVERVARAILKARQERGFSGEALWEYEPAEIQQLFLHCARAAITAMRDDQTLGVPIDLVDRRGNPVHVGDTLRFDADEWGEPHTFVIRIERGAIMMSGAPGDIPEWCEVIMRYDGTTPQ